MHLIRGIAQPLLRPITSLFLFLAFLSTLLACERARLDATSSLTGRFVNEPPEVFFLDPQLPRELCWADEPDEVKRRRIECWSERFPEIRCPELFLLEDFAWNVAEFLENNWRRFLPWGMSQRVYLVDEPGVGSFRVTRLERRSVAMALFENLDGELARIELERWITNRWLPWIQTEPEPGTKRDAAPFYLKCESFIEEAPVI